LNIRTRAKQNPPVASVNAALERDLITLQCEPVASTEFAFNIGPYQVPTAPKLLLCLPSIVIYPRLWLTLTVENGGVLVQCTPTFIGSSKNYKSRQLKSSLQLLTGAITQKNQALGTLVSPQNA
jgi:hypothetical protein